MRKLYKLLSKYHIVIGCVPVAIVFAWYIYGILEERDVKLIDCIKWAMGDLLLSSAPLQKLSNSDGYFSGYTIFFHENNIQIQIFEMA